MSADNGSAKSQLFDSDFLKTENGVEQNVREAVRCIEMAANQNKPEASVQSTAAISYSDCFGRSLPEALRYSKAAADPGDETVWFFDGDVRLVSARNETDSNEISSFVKRGADLGNKD
jgi:hypothetical protein